MPISAAGLYRPDGRALARLAEGSPRSPRIRLISRRRLTDLLLAAAEGIEIRTGVTADAPALHDALANADVLIGADGLRSGVRRAFFGDRTAPRYSGMMGWRGSVGYEATDYGETWGFGQLFGYPPMEPGRTNFYAALPAAEHEPGTFTEMRARFADWHEPIPSILAAADPDDVLRNPIHDLHPALPSFVTDRVALLGDAAHAMTPNLGRGACEAISDAVALATCLTDAHDPPAALRAYDRQRRKPAQRVAARSWRAMKVSRWQALAPLRDGIVRLGGLVAR